MMDRVIKEGKFQNKLLFLTEPLKWFGILSVLVFGTYQVAAGNMSIGLFVRHLPICFSINEKLSGVIPVCI